MATNGAEFFKLNVLYVFIFISEAHNLYELIFSFWESEKWNERNEFVQQLFSNDETSLFF